MPPPVCTTNTTFWDTRMFTCMSSVDLVPKNSA
jgi:hypothetical protein